MIFINIYNIGLLYIMDCMIVVYCNLFFLFYIDSYYYVMLYECFCNFNVVNKMMIFLILL